MKTKTNSKRAASKPKARGKTPAKGAKSRNNEEQPQLKMPELPANMPPLLKHVLTGIMESVMASAKARKNGQTGPSVNGPRISDVPGFPGAKLIEMEMSMPGMGMGMTKEQLGTHVQSLAQGILSQVGPLQGANALISSVCKLVTKIDDEAWNQMLASVSKQPSGKEASELFDILNKLRKTFAEWMGRLQLESIKP